MALARRLALVVVGLGVFATYVLGAVGLYLLLSWLVRGAAPGTTVAVLLAAVAVVGYLNYRVGPARLVAGLDARRLPRNRGPDVHRRLERLAGEMGVDVPPLLVADLGMPNALSVGGPRRSVLVVDRRLLNVLTLDELEGILAHELAHIRGYDTFVQTMAVTLVRVLSGIVGLRLLPLILLAHGIDRGLAWSLGRPTREELLGRRVRLGAQAFVALLLSALVLAVFAYSRALRKIERASEAMRGLRSLLYTHSETGSRLLSTHPPVEERIQRSTDGERRSR